MKISRKAAVRIVSYAAFTFAVLAGFIAVKESELRRSDRQLQYTYERALSQLAAEVDSMDTAMQKCLLYSSPEMIASSCAEIFACTQTAQMAISELPFASNELEATSGFISRLGDYIYFVSRSVSSGTALEGEVYDNLRALSDTASLLSSNIAQMAEDVRTGQLSIYDIDDHSSAEVDLNGITAIESEFPEIPSLIYDGPFSEHISGLTAKLIEGAPEVTEQRACEVAAEFTGLEESVFSVLGVKNGTVPTYMLSARADGGELTVEVTKKGGQLLSLINSRAVPSSQMSAEDAAKNAVRFLEEHGYPDVAQSYWITKDNRTTVNFAYRQGDVICYPDLIKVTIALDTGGVVGFESLGYVMCHTQRELKEPLVSEETAREKVSGGLKILSHSLAVIPTSGKNEVFCHEFKCENEDGRHYILYVNAETGREEKLLILLEDESGTLTV